LLGGWSKTQISLKVYVGGAMSQGRYKCLDVMLKNMHRA